MSKKYQVNVGPKTFNFSTDIALFRMRGGLAGLLDMLNNLTPVLWKIFLLLLFPAYFFLDINQPGVSYLSWLYGFMVVLLFMQIMKRVLSKSDYLPTVPYDILLLVFVSIATISIFVTLVATKGEFSIWGGADLRVISGISLIAYWFVYYLTVVVNMSNDLMQKSIKLLAISSVIAMVLNVVTQVAYWDGIILPLIILAPAMFWQLLTSEKGKIWFLINLIFSLLAVSEFKSAVLATTLGVTFFSASALLIIKNRKTLKTIPASISKDLDKVFGRKLGIAQFIKNNADAVFVLVSAIMILVCIIWTITSKENPFLAFKLSVDSLNLSVGPLKVLLGNGLLKITAGMAIQFVSSYGLLSSAIITAFFVMITVWLVKQIIKGKNQDANYLMFGFLILIPSLIFTILSTASELLFIYLAINMGFIGYLKAKTEKQQLALTGDIQDFAKVKNERTRKVLGLLQILVCLLLVAGTFYFLSLLSQIKLYIV